MQYPSLSCGGIDFYESLIEKRLGILGIIFTANYAKLAIFGTAIGKTWRWWNIGR
tara:strand:- start:313 stop:477 length:165 start_codon:yes stop_codon:yes gene_type:complete